MKKFLVVAPRLDISFKEGVIPPYRGVIPPIRVYWQKFIESLVKRLTEMGTVEYIEIPLWTLNENSYDYSKYTACFIPHHQKKSFLKQEAHSNLYYYMQTSFPEFFTVDKEGWAGSLSFLPLEIYDFDEHNNFKYLKSKFDNNISKFEQPSKDYNKIGYVFFPCQLPHDQTIIYHSDISVEDALLNTIDVCKKLKRRLVVKGHPINPHSMLGLKQICDGNNVEWVDDCNIKSLIKNSTEVVTVNSGVGFESIIGMKPVFTYGKSEYGQLTGNGNFHEWLKSEKNVDTRKIMNYIESLFQHYINSNGANMEVIDGIIK